MKSINLCEAEGLPTIEWDSVVDKLAGRSKPAADAVNAHTTWLTTLDADGAPHVTAVGAI